MRITFQHSDGGILNVEGDAVPREGEQVVTGDDTRHHRTVHRVTWVVDTDDKLAALVELTSTVASEAQQARLGTHPFR